MKTLIKEAEFELNVVDNDGFQRAKKRAEN